MIPARTVPTRRVAFTQEDGELPRHYVSGDLVMSHVVAVLSSLFPNGEDFFVRSVRAYRHEVTDPELNRQVAGFIGQEAMHGRAHRQLNEAFQRLGYPTRLIDRRTDQVLKAVERLAGGPVRLAVTAALEHYTATLAEVLLGDPRAQAMLDTEAVRSFFLWHALEESEHKSVAFDVYQQVDGGHWRRVVVMNAVTVGFLAAVVLATVGSLLRDPASWNLPRLVRSAVGLRRSPFLAPGVARRLRSYNRRGFHPDDWDATELTGHWREVLFGEDGTLTGRVEGPPRNTPPASPPTSA
ncbi:MAG TPA: metal-dependent hydrolase [Acidimicrobiales bacterium]|nr:metal-dependent hydrolase [Acidimicrobiales bacterium]